MGEMVPQLTKCRHWWAIDGNEGVRVFDHEDFTEAQARREYGPFVYTCELVHGFGARLAMPGYLDCTEWTVFDTEAEALQHLLDTYYDAPTDEMSDRDNNYREIIERVLATTKEQELS